MSSFRDAVILLLFISLFQVSTSVEYEQGIRKVWTQSTPSELYKDRYTYFRNNLGIGMSAMYFVECDPPSNITKIRECRLLQGVQSFLNTTKWDACGFQIKPNKNAQRVSPYMRIYEFNFSYLVIWIEYSDKAFAEVKHVNEKLIKVRSYIRFTLIEFATCRVIGEAQTVGSSEELRWYQIQESTSVYLGKQTFDIVYAYSGSNLAEESFDMNGTRIRGPIGESDFKMDPLAVTIPLPPSNRFSSCLRIWPQERLKARPGYRLEYHPSDVLGKYGQDVVGYTTSNGNSTFCKEIDNGNANSWTCVQGEPNSTVTKFGLQFSYKPHTPIIYNMPGGGILTMTSKENQTANSAKEYTFYAQRFETSGLAYEPVEITTLKCKYSTLLLGNIFEDVWGYYCFSFLQDTRYSDFTTKCVIEDVFTQPKQPLHISSISSSRI
ncbi:hypothetical protein QAD02_011887 [Eretmocerus hayati]|uniref:Uncharacterized protein n=1 Tax=Eretmocerus hayati TaxID=131215 RepID=A0ACC2NY63_9HYME|nr:hypothetical protein QAD02_011887 [Eretmocerus hayati]